MITPETVCPVCEGDGCPLCYFEGIITDMEAEP